MFSQDGGRHWLRSVIQSPAQIHTPVSLELRGREGWIGCDFGEVLHTLDGGRNWKQIVRTGAVWSKAHGFGTWGAVYFTSAEVGFALGGDGELFETRDHGATWSKVAVPERIVDLSCVENFCWLTGEAGLYRLQAE